MVPHHNTTAGFFPTLCSELPPRFYLAPEGGESIAKENAYKTSELFNYLRNCKCNYPSANSGCESLHSQLVVLSTAFSFLKVQQLEQRIYWTNLSSEWPTCSLLWSLQLLCYKWTLCSSFFFRGFQTLLFSSPVSCEDEDQQELSPCLPPGLPLCLLHCLWLPHYRAPWSTCLWWMCQALQYTWKSTAWKPRHSISTS